ncbi:MAG: hypothetical protein R3F17_16070 [Planctomycetota bacterium]
MVGQLSMPLAALLGYWFANEPLQGTTLAAMGLTMAGVLLVISDPVTARGGRHKAFKAGVTFALLQRAVTIASGIFVGHVGIKDLEIVPGAVVRLLGGMCGAFLFAPLWGIDRRLLGDRSTSAAVELRGLVERFTDVPSGNRCSPLRSPDRCWGCCRTTSPCATCRGAWRR